MSSSILTGCIVTFRAEVDEGTEEQREFRQPLVNALLGRSGTRLPAVALNFAWRSS
jgi:hypothetical protein